MADKWKKDNPKPLPVKPPGKLPVQYLDDGIDDSKLKKVKIGRQPKRHLKVVDVVRRARVVRVTVEIREKTGGELVATRPGTGPLEILDGNDPRRRIKLLETVMEEVAKVYRAEKAEKDRELVGHEHKF